MLMGGEVWHSDQGKVGTDRMLMEETLLSLAVVLQVWSSSNNQLSAFWNEILPVVSACSE